MGDLEPGRAAVELPRVWRAQRRRDGARRLTGLSGILLFACMFLPAVKDCDRTVVPLDVPMLLPPYLYGLIFAGIAIARSARGIAWGVLALRLLTIMVAAGSVAVLIVALPAGIVVTLLGGALLAIIRLTGTSESRVAATGFAVSLVSLVWFGFWAATGTGLIGVYLSVASAAGMLVGCVAWLRELAHHPAVDLPRAVAATARRP